MDRPLEEALTTILGCRAMIGLDSGLAILAKYMGVPTLQAYPQWLCDPDHPDKAQFPNGTHMPGTWEMDAHPKSSWCYVHDLMDAWGDWMAAL
jgi:hypothetical protein